MEFAELILTPKLDNVVLHCPFQKPVDGTLCITGHHLILSSRKHGVEELWLLHRNVDSVERRPNGLLGGSLVVKCKDLRIIQLDVNSADEFVKVATSIERLSSIDEPMLLYPFFYRPMYAVLEDGWTAFRPETEFSALIADGWRVSAVNREFRVCPTYPAVLVVPRGAADADVAAAAAFRDGGRFPVPAYRHAATGGCLMRSGQPMTGQGGRRCKEDERLLNSVLGPGKRGYIVDTRAQGLAQAAKSRGGGFEVEMHYPQWRRVSKPIDRHPVLLDSFSRLVEACNDVSLSTDRWLSRLDSSGWMTHIKDTLNCACLVAQCLDQEGASVLVHGSEGLDATLLVTSLAQVILNPDCRTVRGLEALVEREWLQAGHPFPARHARSCYATAPGRGKDSAAAAAAAPTFLLFLDCLHQVHQQFPASFEFNTHMLVTLFEHSYSSQFGTFLGQSEADRVFLKLSARTVSLWSYLNRPEVLATLISPLYEPNARVLWPSVAPVSLCLWAELLLRWVVDPAPQQAATNRIAALRDRDKELRLKVTRLRTQLAALEREALAAGVIPAPAPTQEITQD